jgi:hypothetical protein
MSASEYLAWAQLVVLVVTAWLVWRYVRSTEKIEEAAADQVEAMSRPVLVPRIVGTEFHLTNVGSGPALRIEWWQRPQEEAFAAPKELVPDAQIGLIETKGESVMVGAPDFRSLAGNNRKIICRYRSISGRVYLSQGVPRTDPISGQWLDAETKEENEAK